MASRALLQSKCPNELKTSLKKFAAHCTSQTHRSTSAGGISEFQSFQAGIHCLGYLRILTHRTATTQVQAPQAEVVPASALSQALCKTITNGLICT